MAPPEGFLTVVRLFTTQELDEAAYAQEADTEPMVPELPEPEIPTLDSSPKELDVVAKSLEMGAEHVPAPYSVRGDSDVMLSGPVTGGWGPGRWFPNRSGALNWAVSKYGSARVVVPEAQSAGRWCLLIKNLRSPDVVS